MINKKVVQISVGEFAVPAPRRGSIEAQSGFARGSQTGLELHQLTQEARKKQDSSYESEVSISRRFETDLYVIEVRGRMDGFYKKKKVKIEEIKSSFNIQDLAKKLKQTPEHPFNLQLLTYGYFHFLDKGEIPELNMHLISSRNFETLDIPFKLDVKIFEMWLQIRLEELNLEAAAAEKREKRRKKVSGNLKFPFENPRSGQIELIQSIKDTIKQNRPMMIQAPTGLGKTVGVMFPTLQDALSRGQRLIYVTPKNSQHQAAEEAIGKLQDAGALIKSLTLTAKSKMCFKNEPVCNPDFCEYANEHYTKVAENKLVELLAKKKKLTAKVFIKIAEEFEVCPFELQLAAVPEADTLICDYNYVFAPRAALGGSAGLSLDQQGKPNLVIDEAHNLPARAMDYYSPSLSVITLERMRLDLPQVPRKSRSDFSELLEQCIRVVKGCAPGSANQKPSTIKPPVSIFLEQDQLLRAFLSTYLNSDVEIQANDVVLKLSFYWSEFTNALEFVNSGRKEFFTTFNPNPATIKISCCDAAEMLKDCYDEFNQVVAFSATLKPFGFYSELSGLADKNLMTAEFGSPFPKKNRKILIIPQLSSKFSERERNYPRIAETVERIVQLKSGNYFVFLPSFDFLEKVSLQFKAPKGFSILKQMRQMKRQDIDSVLEKLHDKSFAHVIFAVQGGVFSEGVDYPGEMIIGAFVVGPSLPNFDLERETMKNYYQRHYSAGFDYAYTYPAMAKSVQAAGRVIRSETDKGLIVLIDDRFIQQSYVKSLPQDWFVNSATELVSDSILKDVENFWGSFG